MKRLWNRAGETLVETMFSLAIISVTFVFLTGAVVAATRVNSKIRNSGSEFKKGSETPVVSGCEIHVKDENDRDIKFDDPIKVDIYQSEENEEGNRYYYYRMN